MELNLNELKQNSYTFENELRFPISNLKIKIGNNWKSFDNLIGLVELESGVKLNIKLNDLLLDTGNETNYCVISAYYLDAFRKVFGEIALEKRIMSTFQGTHITTAISFDSFKFNIFDCTFSSRIGFTYQTNLNALDVLNIGIKGIKQFFNVIFPEGNRAYYFCQNI